MGKSLVQAPLTWGVTLTSVVLCLLLLPLRLPGLELAGVGPNWLLVWVVAWSVKRTPLTGLWSGVVLGLLQDALTAPQPTHVLSLALVGYLTARLKKQQFTQEDLISISLIVFAMAVLAETIIAVQFSLQEVNFILPRAYQLLQEIWVHQQQVSLASAILSSLWAPALYYPLNLWWERRGVLPSP